MGYSIIDFLQDYQISHIVEGHKHCRPGWIQIPCPFCAGNPGWHLGVEIEHGWWNCWRCGPHKSWDVVVSLLHGDRAEAKKILNRLSWRNSRTSDEIGKIWKPAAPPSGLQPLTRRAKKYLVARNFDPYLLELIWKIESTSNLGDLKYRIFIPVFENRVMVSWQCRDILDISKYKYIAPTLAPGIVNIKDTLYGLDAATGDSCVIVEGVTDAWRLGPGAVATFGIKFRRRQVQTLLKRFKEFHILFDPDPQALEQAKKLANDLAGFGKTVELWSGPDCDPGDFTQSDADHFMREALGHAGY